MLRFFNTYSRALEEFAPRDPPNVSMYTCGPTVYSNAHIGNFRAYIFEDLLQRHLETRGFKVHRVMNITDVDDKTIRGAREAKISLNDFTEPFKRGFFEDLDTLRIKRANEYPGATEPRYLARMIEMIAELIKRDLAYQAEDKSVYFRINKFPEYGKLAHLNLEELRPTGRVRSDEYEKENIGDFALWKAWDEEDGDVGWDSPWGRGRPGWHIECSAMSTVLLGDQLDIHCGGVDNIFPHHEAEIAQSEGVTGKKFVRYWMHCAHLLVDNQKMSKSLGNFYTLRDVVAKGYSGREVRYALLRVHYRVQLNFTFEGMEESRQALTRIDEWLERLRETSATTSQEVERSTQCRMMIFIGHLMTILIFPARSAFCSNPFAKRIARWTQTNSARLPRRRGSSGGTKSIACSASILSEPWPCRRRSRRWPKAVVSPDLPRSGKKAMNCAGN